MFAASKTSAPSGGPKDAQFNYVTMLLHGDGTNGAQNNTFVDGSINNYSITRNGNTTQGSFSPYGSNWSNYIGSGNKLDGPTNAAFAFGTGDFTISAWVFIADGTSSQIIWTNQTTSSANAPNLVFFILNNNVCIANTNTAHVPSSGTIANNTWNYVGVTRSSGTYTFYINGSTSGTTSSIGTDNITENACHIGYGNYGSSYYFGGYISNLRVIKGSAVTPTVPTTPLTAISGTSLLTCQSNRYIDNSSNAFTITTTGTPSVQRFNPFGTSTAYSTSVIGGSGYFDGTGDNLTASTNISLSGNFCIEAWFKTTTTTTYACIFSDESVSNGTTILLNNGSNNGQITVYSKNIVTNFASTVTGLNNNAWHHVAFTRSGSTCYLFVDGVQQNTTTGSGTSTGSTALIGTSFFASRDFLGYISDFRFVTGSAVYTSAFTPPTTPLTAISGTQLLLSMQNGAIYDNAMINNLETVGNAQISTSVKKFGTGSLYFDGTGDYLTLTNLNAFTLTTGNWTIEGWVNPTTISGSAASNTIFANGYPVQIYVQNNNVAMYVSSTNTSGTYFVNPALGPTSSLSTNVWSHFACVKNGNNYTVYVNGVAGTTVTSSTAPAAPNTTTAMNVGSWNNTNAYYTGYIDDLRITNGYARYTSNFTAPTAAFSNTGPI